MGKKARTPHCHPQEKHEAKGMCRKCYATYRTSLPEVIERKKHPDKVARSRAIKLKYWRSEKGQNKHKEYYASEQGTKIREAYRDETREKGRYRTDKYKAQSKVRKEKYRRGKGKIKDAEYKKSPTYRAYLDSPEYKLMARRNSAFRKKKQRIASLGKGFRTEMREIYGNCPEGYHVDHIIPLINDFVSGLNVPWNLQILTAKDNLRKQDKFDFTYYNNGWKFPIFS